eukprot:6648903-Pyramimonas_sp.AAC.1
MVAVPLRVTEFPVGQSGGAVVPRGATPPDAVVPRGSDVSAGDSCSGAVFCIDPTTLLPGGDPTDLKDLQDFVSLSDALQWWGERFTPEVPGGPTDSALLGSVMGSVQESA